MADDQPRKPKQRPKIKSSFGAVLNNTQKRMPDSEQPESPPHQDTSTLVSPSPDISVHQDTNSLVSPSPDIPVIQEPSTLIAQSPDAPGLQDTSTLVSPPPDIPVPQETNILPSKKAKRERTKKGVYLKPATAKWLDVQAAIEGKEISELTEEALILLRKVREGKAEVTEI